MESNALLDLPHEILHIILTFVDPTDLVALQRCCHEANEFVGNNGLLIKELFLRDFVSHCHLPPFNDILMYLG